MYKIPLRYQATEYDCGSAAIINAINYVFDFSEIPAYFLKEIYDVCLDECNQNGISGEKGTSCAAMKFLCGWFNRYHQKTGFPIQCQYFEKEEVSFRHGDKLLSLLQKKNVAIVLKIIMFDEHFITLTDADDEYIYTFDPYYWIKDYGGDARILRVDEPLRANRKFPIGFMETTTDKFYNLSMLKDKIAVVFERKGNLTI